MAKPSQTATLNSQVIWSCLEENTFLAILCSQNMAVEIGYHLQKPHYKIFRNA